MNRINCFIGSILFFFMTTCFSQEVVIENDSLLLWQADRSLTWEDFKGAQRNYHGNVLAEACGKIKTVDTYWIGETPKFNIRCYFIKTCSWTITDDPESLEHEQIHFDIYELFTRKIRKAFDELNQNNISDLKKYTDTFSFYLQENEKHNEMYDIDVVTDQTKQLEWKAEVLKELEELKEYEYVPEE